MRLSAAVPGAHVSCSLAEVLHSALFVHGVYQFTIVGPADALLFGDFHALVMIPWSLQASLVVVACIVLVVQVSPPSGFPANLTPSVLLQLENLAHHAEQGTVPRLLAARAGGDES